MFLSNVDNVSFDSQTWTEKSVTIVYGREV